MRQSIHELSTVVDAAWISRWSSWPKPFTDDGFDDEEFYLTGRATPVADADLHTRISAAVGDKPESGQSFELGIQRALHTRRDGEKGYDIWRPDRD